MWLKYAIKFTLNREDNGGNAQIGVAANLGAQAFTQTMVTMEAEFPTIVYAYSLNSTLDFTKNDCNSTYIALGFPVPASEALCNSSVTGTYYYTQSPMFNFSDPLTTSFALVNIF
jgi:hypothetical protein